MAPPPLSGDAFHDASNTGPRTTPTLPNGGLFSIYAATEIAAPPRFVYEAVIDVAAWPEWNTFVPAVQITKHPRSHASGLKMAQGSCMTFTVAMEPGAAPTTSKEVCNHLEPLKHRGDGRASHAAGGNVTRIRWALDNANLLAPGFVIRAERVNEIEEAGPAGAETTRYRTWEAFGGVAAGTVRRKYEAVLRARFADWCRDLKARAEELYAREKGPAGDK